eukprot:Skav211096  [mRNA]  locus=scaffold2002:396193:397574:+ [translate_table: standard]
MFGARNSRVDKRPMFWQIRDVPRPRSTAFCLAKSVPLVAAPPVETSPVESTPPRLIPIESSSRQHLHFGLPTPPEMGESAVVATPTEIDDETPMKDDQVNTSSLGAPYVHQEGSSPCGPLRRSLQFDPVECELLEDDGGDEVVGASDPKECDAIDFAMNVAALGGEDPAPPSATDVAEPMDEDQVFPGSPTHVAEPVIEEQVPPGSSTDVAEPNHPIGVKPNEVLAIGDDNSLGDELDHELENAEPQEVVEEAEPEETPKDTRRHKTSEKHRANSAAWHKKYVSKGVLRESYKSSAAVKCLAAKSKAAPKKNRPPPAEPSPVTNLAQAKSKFIQEWIQGCGLPQSNERRVKAYKAWMESSQRSSLMAGKKGVQQ